MNAKFYFQSARLLADVRQPTHFFIWWAWKCV